MEKNEQRLGQLKNLLLLAVADGRVTDEEIAVLAAVASREGLTPEQFNAVIDNPDSVQITLPQEEPERMLYLRDMVTLMMSDGEIDDEEKAICKVYAMALGYRATVVNELIDNITEELSHA